MTKIALGVAAVLVILALVISISPPPGSSTRSKFDQFAVDLANNPSPKIRPPSLSDGMNEEAIAPLSHRAPPPPAALANNPTAQSVYDAGAAPGDFVTPPSVSIEH